MMKVTLLANTQLTDSVYYILSGLDANITDADHLAELSGRTCYESFSRPNPKTRENRDYLDNILAQKHESVLAHASATFLIEGVSRNLTHELVRHRFLAFSQRSQRYVDESNSSFVIPEGIKDSPAATASFLQSCHDAMAAYRIINAELTGAKKRVREAARAVLPGALETTIVVSGNMRAWLDFLRQRLSPGADREIHALALELYEQLSQLAPNTFQGIDDLGKAE